MVEGIRYAGAGGRTSFLTRFFVSDGWRPDTINFTNERFEF